MKSRSWYFLLLLAWLIPTLACSGGSAALATSTPKATTRPQATATSGTKPKATATAGTKPKATATADSNTTAAGQFDAIQFAVGVQDDEKAIDTLDSFPDGVTLIYAVFDYSGMQASDNWRTEWKLDGEVQPDLGTAETWKGDESGSWWISIYNEKGVRTGDWELNLYIGDDLKQTGTFKVEANPAGQPDFGPITFAPDKTDDDKPLNPLDFDKPILPDGTTTVYAFFDGIDVPKDTAWTSQWFLNGQPASDPKDHTWDFDPNENNWISFGTNDNSPLDSGTYELHLSIGGTLVNLATYIMP